MSEKGIELMMKLIKTLFLSALLPLIIILSGCVVLNECPPTYGVDIEKLETTDSIYINVTRSELISASTIVSLLDELISNESLDSIMIELDRHEWNQTVELFEQLFDEEFKYDPWVIRYYERFYRIEFWIMVC